ncbi:MAG: response regulator transcription factor [Arachidicoccus sp.]|nr:response regulator transcription factor [Arachidicoccus sp.]
MIRVEAKIKVAIVEDNIAMRNGLAQLLNEHGRLEVVTVMSDSSQLVTLFRKANPDVVLMDIELKNSDSGIDAVKTIHYYFPSIRVLMFTVFEDDEKIFDSICAGASGYLLKKTPPEEIIFSLISLYNGGAPMTPAIANKALQLFREKMNPQVNDFKLSGREKEILQLLSEGFSYQKIADKLFISISTIRTHICHIYDKLHVSSKMDAVRKFKKN